MADLYRRLPLLLLVTVLLLAVVVFHICFLSHVPGRKQTRRTPKRGRKMEKLQTKTELSVRAGGSSRQRCSNAEGGRRPYDPTMYSHLPSHEISLPPSDDEGDNPRSSTVPLGSSSTQDWMGSQLYRQASTPTYTDLLEGRTAVGYDAGLVDLSFGLRSGSVEDVTHTVLVNPASGTNHTPASVRASGLPDNRAWCSGQSGNERGLFSSRRGAVGTAGVAAPRTTTGGSAPTTPGGTIDGRGDNEECSAAEVVGRKVWDDHRRQSRQASTSGITRGVAKINVGAGDKFGDCDGAGGKDCVADDGSNDNDEDDDGEMEIRPVGRKWGGGDHTIHPTNLADTGAAGGVQMIGPRGGRNESGGSEGCGDGQDDDQGSTRDSTFSGGGGGGGGKRKNVRQQTFDTIADVMKEHGNLMATTVDNASKRQCSVLTRQCDILERELEVQKEHYVKADQVNFMMCNALLEIGKAILADEMAPRSASGKGRKDSGVGKGGETQKGRGHVPKSKRQRVDEASSEHTDDFQADKVVMVDVQGTVGAMRLRFGRDGVSREQLSAIKQSVVVGAVGALPRTPKGTGVVITEACVPRQLPAVVGQGQPRQPLPVQQAGASGGGKTPSAQKGEATASGSRTAAANHTTRSGLAEGAEEGRVDDFRRDDGRRDGEREGDDDDDRPLVMRLKGAAKEDDLEERSKLWVDCDAFWGQGPGKPLREAVGDCADYFVVIANGDAGAEPPLMLIMPPNDVPLFKIEDPAQPEPALRRARSMEKLVLRTIHDWIFKSSSRSTGFARAESYITVDVATDVARGVWQGFEWSKVVSPALVHHTSAMKMDVPLWFAGVKIVDRPEDDDMAARQEATVLRLAGCWIDAVWCGQWTDGGRVKQERLLRLTRCGSTRVVPTSFTNRLGKDFIGYTDWFTPMKDIVSLEVIDLVSTAGNKKPMGGRRFKGSSRFVVHDLLKAEEEADADDPTLGLEPEATKVEVIRNWPQPANIRELHSFLGLASYYRKFVPRFSIVARPLSWLTSKNVPYSWDTTCKDAFQALKEALVSYPVLCIADPRLTFVVTTDASQYGIGAVLQQDDGDGLRPLEFYSKCIHNIKVATSTYMRELYALCMALDNWKHYLLGRHFKVFSDHETLKWIKEQTTLSPTLLRWFHEIDIFDFELRHKKVCYNRVADALSRHPKYMTCLVKSYDLRKKLKEEFVEHTAKDPELSPILERLRANPTSQPDFHEYGGLIFRRYGNHDRLCVPNHEPLRTHFLDLAHGQSGHFGMVKMYANLLRQFDWPDMKGTAEKFVAECQVCQRIKPCRQKPMGLLTPLPIPEGNAEKFVAECQVCQRIKPCRQKHMGLLTPLPIPEGSGESVSIDFTDLGKVSKNGYSQVMVIVDRFSKFLNLIPLPLHAPTKLVIREFQQKYILQFETPKTLVSDRDPRFICTEWKDFTSQLGIRLCMTSGRHPEANGLAEEINQTVFQLLRALIIPDQETWDEEMYSVKGLYNNSVHSATGMTPNRLHYGWQIRNPLSYLFPEQPAGLTPAGLAS
ncbi:hypothetical protein CBR_g40617 [Chara braunii]|uniref:Integrase catalytic domain-containing protein n=1 Tax=Chara braunii TaxID=69332 RepID=A0A388LU16_CHABU|nr:hypothetical protein CBR_g40617 [Chara braunii]|eukprot:GBG85807.1 hypothetical protein CBR_g40617 [Chara braunii]